MTVLDPAAGYFINTFDVTPDKAEALLAHLSTATKQIFLHAPGFVSANLHLAHDHRHAANYANWRSKRGYDAAVQSPEAQVHRYAAAAFASGLNPIFYDLLRTRAVNRLS